MQFGIPKKFKTPIVPVKAEVPRDEQGKPIPPIGDPRLVALTARSAYDQNKAYEDGAARFDPLFGMNNPAMKEIMDARRSAAFGQDGYADTLRAQGVQGINSTMSTGLRSLRGMQAGSGVRGGAALGQALPMLTQANQARSGLESNIALADMQRRSAALGDLESTVTGERAGSLGANFGWTGLDSANRNNALQYLTSMDFMKNAQTGMNAAGGPAKPPSLVNVGTAGNSVYKNKTGGDPSSGNKANTFTEQIYEYGQNAFGKKKKK